MEDQPTTIILRFRDLVTAKGGTIQAHKEIYDKGGYVWWGWWNKARENVPFNQMRNLLTQACKEDLEIFLFDSGGLGIYKVLCTDIKWDIKGEPINSPELEKTPIYYRDKRYKLWFKFSKINSDNLQETTLKEYTYVDVADFFSDSQINYEQFSKKQISSFEELRQQDRTIWFIRKYNRRTDLTHEIKLLDSYTISPCHFTKNYLQTKGNCLLWLSDLHFDNDYKAHNFPTKTDQFQRDISQSLERACDKFGLKDKISGLIISGDITWRARPEEYELALSQIEYVRSWARIERYAVGFCPGNHDLSFSENPDDKTAKVTKARELAIKSYENFYQKSFYLTPNEYLCSGRKYLFSNGIPVEIVFINSSLLQQEENAFQGHGFIGEQQLDLITKQMGWENDYLVTPTRIAVLHHHIIPVTFREEPTKQRIYSVTLDAEAVVKWSIENKIKLILHGHMHQPFYSKITRRMDFESKKELNCELHIAALGSSGVITDHLGEIHENIFGVIDFSEEKIKLHYYSLHKTNESKLIASIEL